MGSEESIRLMSLENRLRILPTEQEKEDEKTSRRTQLNAQVSTGLADGVDVKEVDGRADDGAEHAVVQILCRPDQAVEDQQTPDEAKRHSSCRQTYGQSQRDGLPTVVNGT